MVIGVYREYNVHCVHLCLASGYLALCNGRDMLWKERERGREGGREGSLHNYFHTRGQVLADTNLFLLTLVTDGVFFELLHNSLNIFGIRDPKCVNWGGWMTNTSVQ